MRKQSGWSMREAAKRIGVPETTYREWEYGRAIRGEPYAKIAEAFGITVEMLLGQTDQQPLTLERRVKRILDDITAVHTEILKSKIK